MKTSDHKPVSGMYHVDRVKVFARDKMKDVWLSVARELDKMENDTMPGMATWIIWDMGRRCIYGWCFDSFTICTVWSLSLVIGSALVCVF